MARFAWACRARFLILTVAVILGGCVPSDRKETGAGSWSNIKIVLDPGHGGRDLGASPDGSPAEKEIVLEIATRVQGILKQKGLAVLLTRQTDEYVSLSRRASFSNDNHPTLFVSIHANSCPSAEVNGFEIYYAEDGRERDTVQAANFIQQSLKKATDARDRGIRKFNYTVLARTKCPSVLIEVGYLSNPGEASLLSKSSYRKKVAEGIADGILAYGKTRL